MPQTGATDPTDWAPSVWTLLCGTLVQLCPSKGVAPGPPLHWEPPQRVGAAPQHTPQESRGTGRQHPPAHRQAEEDVVSEQGAKVWH